MKKIKLGYVILFLVVVLCTSWIFFPTIYNLFDEQENACGPTPKWISNADLVGTWQAQEIDSAKPTTDTLILRADGTYKQIIYRKRQGYDREATNYETDWQKWRIEYGKNGSAYLYLQDFRICAFATDVSCDWLDDSPHSWLYFCDEPQVEPSPGEVILTILAPSSRTDIKSDIALIIYRGYENSAWLYRFQEP